MKEYKRFTIRDEYGNADIFGVDSELLYSELSAKENIALTNAFNCLAEFEDKIEQGKIIELPCKVGTTIYHILEWEVKQDVVFRYEFELDTKQLVYFYKYIEKAKKAYRRPFELVENFNKTWFLTKAEAEKKLKELKGEV